MSFAVKRIVSDSPAPTVDYRTKMVHLREHIRKYMGDTLTLSITALSGAIGVGGTVTASIAVAERTFSASYPYLTAEDYERAVYNALQLALFFAGAIDMYESLLPQAPQAGEPQEIASPPQSSSVQTESELIEEPNGIPADIDGSWTTAPDDYGPFPKCVGNVYDKDGKLKVGKDGQFLHICPNNNTIYPWVRNGELKKTATEVEAYALKALHRPLCVECGAWHKKNAHLL